MAHARGDEARAVGLFRQSVVHNASLGDKEIAARAVSGLAAVASERGQFSLAARLYGSVAALREAIGAPLAPSERARHERAVAATRAALAEATFASAWDEGRAMPLDRAIAGGLSIVDAAES